jgi:hypothetical protein
MKSGLFVLFLLCLLVEFSRQGAILSGGSNFRYNYLGKIESVLMKFSL